jgi:hypothetical protein
MERAYDALVDKDGDGEAEEADNGKAAARPAEVELEVLPASVPLLDPLVLGAGAVEEGRPWRRCWCWCGGKRRLVSPAIGGACGGGSPRGREAAGRAARADGREREGIGGCWI